jgi:hypothetical protein
MPAQSRDGQESIQYFIAVLGQNRLGVKLKAHHRKISMSDRHYRAVNRPGGDFQT